MHWRLSVKDPETQTNIHFSLFQRYYLVVNICREAPVENLVRAMTTRKIYKASVIAERKSERATKIAKGQRS